MSAVELVIMCFIYEGVNAFTTESQNGVTVRLDAGTHVFVTNQSDNFIFEVQSCENVNIIMEYKNEAFLIVLDPKNDLSSMVFCNQPEANVFYDCGEEDFFSTADFCSTFISFWVKELDYDYEFGTGCTVGQEMLSSIFFQRDVDRTERTLDVSSTGQAKWKFGKDTCGQATTTTTVTTSNAPSLKTTMTMTSTKSGLDPDRHETGSGDVLCKSAAVSTLGGALACLLTICRVLLMRIC